MVNIDTTWTRLKQLKSDLNKTFSYFTIPNSRTVVILFDEDKIYFTITADGSDDHNDFVSNYQLNSTQENVLGIV